MIYNAFLFGDIGKIIQQAIRTFFGTLAATIYTVISYLYDVFILIAKAEILNSDLVQSIYRSVGMILGLFMIFKLTFSLIQALIDPEKLTDKKNGFSSIIMRSVIAIVLLGITPSLFKEAFKLQNLLIGVNNSNDNIIYKLILQNKIGVNSSEMGQKLAADLYFSFYTDEEFPKYDLGTGKYDEKLEERFQRINYETLKENVTTRAKKSDGESNWNFYDTIGPLTIRRDSQFVIEFNEIFINVVGTFILYMLFIYCFQVAARVFKLAFLQLIAPIPILSYISDPDGSFKKWIKQCTSTYLDLFLRLIIIYFVMYLSSDVLDQLNSTDSILMNSINGQKLSFFTIVLIKIFLVIGLLIFAKKVPELIEDIFPNLKGKAGFGFGLSLKKNVFDPVKDIGKSLYNTPLGWGLKGGKKLGSYIDRKAHHLPKPRGKFGQAIDKWLPGHADAHKSRLEMDDRHKLEQEGKEIYAANGGKLTANDFSSNEYRESWTKVKKAKDELEQMDKEVEYYRNEIAQGRMDPNNSRYQDAIKRQKAASSRLDAAKQDHENIRKIHAKDARKEDAFKYYKDMHGSDSGRSREEIISNISEMRQANGKEERTGFTDAERQAEAQRRESQRSSYNNEHESQLASQSIFSDNEAMRQSDMEYNTGVSRPNASDNGAPTAENSIFNDANAMRDSDARYNQTQNSNNDTRVYQNGDDVGE